MELLVPVVICKKFELLKAEENLVGEDLFALQLFYSAYASFRKEERTLGRDQLLLWKELEDDLVEIGFLMNKQLWIAVLMIKLVYPRLTV